MTVRCSTWRKTRRPMRVEPFPRFRQLLRPMIRETTSRPARSFLRRDILGADDEAQATDLKVVVSGGAGLLSDRPGISTGPQVCQGDGDPESGGSVAGWFPVEPAIQVG